jgi:integral membrane protein
MMTLRTFRYVALAEATSFLALLAATVIKRTSDEEIGVQVLGPIHGALFIAYVCIALSIRTAAGWTPRETVLILVGAVLPFGGYVVDWWLLRRKRLSPSGPR